MSRRLLNFLIILPILLHFNLFDLIHPAHNFDLKDNCPICQFHSYQNNADTDDSEGEDIRKYIPEKDLTPEDISIKIESIKTPILIRGPPVAA